jgi:hypothetical protein
MKPTYEEARNNYMRIVEDLIYEHRKVYEFLDPIPVVSYDSGLKYDKIITVGGQTMVHSFLRKSDGAILKAKSWKGPDTKHVRGSIYADDGGRSAITWAGAKYL